MMKILKSSNFTNILNINYKNTKYLTTLRSYLFPSFYKKSGKCWIEEENTNFSFYNLIYPIFISDQPDHFEEIKNFPNQYRHIFIFKILQIQF